MDSLFKMALTLHVIGGALSGSLGSAKMEFQINRDQTWFEIVECVLRRKPSNHNTTWRLEHPCNGLLGTDVPLSTKVADTPGLNSEIAQQAQLRLHLACTLNAVIPYETVQYALAFHQAKLPWPLWKSNDVDVINQEAMDAGTAGGSKRTHNYAKGSGQQPGPFTRTEAWRIAPLCQYFFSCQIYPDQFKQLSARPDFSAALEFPRSIPFGAIVRSIHFATVGLGYQRIPMHMTAP